MQIRLNLQLLAGYWRNKMKTHTFNNSGEAYDFCQCHDATDGDILIIPSEEVIGVADTWPLAITVPHGELHTPQDNLTIQQLNDSMNVYNNEKIDFIDSFTEAVKIAVLYSYDINDTFRELI